MESLSEQYSYLFLLGLLNSNYVSRLYTDIRGGDYHVVPEHLRQIPIPFANQEIQKTIASLVNTIMDNRASDREYNSLQQQLDSIVETLYAKRES